MHSLQVLAGERRHVGEARASSVGPEHQRQRRAELVADVREERRLGAIERRERLGAGARVLQRMGIGDGGGNLLRDEPQEPRIPLVEGSRGVEAEDREAVGRRSAAARERYDDSPTRGLRERPAGERAERSTGRHFHQAARSRGGGKRPAAGVTDLDVERDGVERRGALGRHSSSRDQRRGGAAGLHQIDQRERDVVRVGLEDACGLRTRRSGVRSLLLLAPRSRSVRSWR